MHGHTLNGRRLFPPYAMLIDRPQRAGEISWQGEVIGMELTYLVLTIVLLVTVNEVIKNIKEINRPSDQN